MGVEKMLVHSKNLRENTTVKQKMHLFWRFYKKLWSKKGKTKNHGMQFRRYTQKKNSFIASLLQTSVVCCKICKQSFRLENGRIFIVNVFSFVINSVSFVINLLSFSFVVNAFYSLLRNVFRLWQSYFRLLHRILISHLY